MRAVDGVEPRAALRRGAGGGRRVGQRQVGDGADPDGPDPGAERDDLRQRRVRGHRPGRGRRRGAAATARQPDGDDLPGPDELARPGLPGRRPDRRADPGAPRNRQGGGARAGDRAARRGRHPRRGGPRRRLPARVLRRDAAAGDDRDGALAGAGAADRRRADDGARRHRAGADHRPAAAAQPRARPLDPPDHPRHRRRRRNRRPGRGDVRGADRRVRHPRRDLLRRRSTPTPGAC